MRPGVRVTDFLVRRIAEQPRSVPARALLGLVCGLIALGVRLALVPYIGSGAPFGAFVLAVLAASVFGGVAGGATCAAFLGVAGPMLVAGGDAIADRRRILSLLFFLASSGFVIWITHLLRAALAREVAARETERLLRLELHHRVKNTLAVVQSISDQTFRGAADAEAARHDFSARLVGLADAHDLLVDAGWRDVTMAALAERVLAPFRPAAGDRLQAAGDAVEVSPETAVALALCLHELATNATKHGALSTDGGRVRLTWRTEQTAAGPWRLSIAWTETGGPRPTPAARRGFGVRLLSRALGAQANAESNLAFPPEGATWTAAIDLAADPAPRG